MSMAACTWPNLLIFKVIFNFEKNLDLVAGKWNLGVDFNTIAAQRSSLNENLEEDS